MKSPLIFCHPFLPTFQAYLGSTFSKEKTKETYICHTIVVVHYSLHSYIKSKLKYRQREDIYSLYLQKIYCAVQRICLDKNWIIVYRNWPLQRIIVTLKDRINVFLGIICCGIQSVSTLDIKKSKRYTAVVNTFISENHDVQRNIWMGKNGQFIGY